MRREKEFELISHSKIESLRDEVERLKAGKGTKQTTQTVVNSLFHLTNTLEKFMGMFEDAVDEMRAEEHEEEVFLKEIKPLMDKLDMVLEQNEKIAQGVVAVADMVNNLKMPSYAAPKPTQLQPRTQTIFSPESHEFESTTTFDLPPPAQYGYNIPAPSQQSMPTPPPLGTSMPPPPPVSRQKY